MGRKCAAAMGFVAQLERPPDEVRARTDLGHLQLSKAATWALQALARPAKA